MASAHPFPAPGPFAVLRRMAAARSRATLWALLALAGWALLSLAGCASGHAALTLPEGITVHTFRREYANVFVVAQGDRFFMVDAGYEADAPQLAQDLRREGFDPAQLRAIILTHGHADHAGGAGYFRRHFGIPVVAGAPDVRLLERGSPDPLCPTSDRARDRLEADQAERFTPIAPDRALSGEVALQDLVGLPGRVVPMPGHTEGSLVVVVPGAAFVGDQFRGAIVGRSAELHFYMCDLEGNRRDVQRLLTAVAPEAHTFFPGHFGPIARAAVVERFGTP